MKERVEKEEPWAWARGELATGRLDQEMNDIKLSLSEFDSVWIMSSSAELTNLEGPHHGGRRRVYAARAAG